MTIESSAVFIHEHASERSPTQQYIYIDMYASFLTNCNNDVYNATL